MLGKTISWLSLLAALTACSSGGESPAAVEAEAGAAGASGAAGSAGASGEAGAAGEPQAPRQIRVATFNAQNFFNDKADDPPPLGDEEVATTAEYKAKLAGVARILKRLNADVVMMEEIENEAVLADLQAQPELGGRYTERATFKGNDPRGIDIGALSTVPFTQKISHKNDVFAVAGGGGGTTYKFARDLLELHADINGRHMIFLGVHFKAKSSDDPQKRLAEAQRTRFVADQLMKADPTAGVIILGDFNDFPGSPPLNAIEGQPPTVFTSMGLQTGSGAWSALSQSAPGGRALHDDLRVSPFVFERLVKGSATILHDEMLDADLRDLSDHAPVAATYSIN